MRVLVVGPYHTSELFIKYYLQNCSCVHYSTDGIQRPEHHNNQLVSLLKHCDLIVVTEPQFLTIDEFDCINNSHIPLVCPSLPSIQLERSKIFTKELLTKLNIPTPDYTVCTTAELIKGFKDIKRPFVLKYDEHIYRKELTTIVTDDNYNQSLKSLLLEYSKKYIKPNQKFILEQYVDGPNEISYHAVVNNISHQPIGSARDYKKRYESDLGPNTDGMGSYGITQQYPIIDQYLNTIVNHLKQINTPYKGFIFLGIKFDNNGVPNILEINCRPGITEIYSILPLINNQIDSLLYDIANDNQLPTIQFNNKKTVTVRFKTNRQPLPMTNLIITSNHNYTDNIITAVEDTINIAADRCYQYCNSIEPYDYRTDIGYLL